MEDNISLSRTILKYDQGQFIETTDQIAVEYPLTIILDDEEFATMVCTPTHLEELVVGFLASEGIIREYSEIKRLQVNADEGFAYVDLYRKQSIGKEFYSKRFIGSCCGKGRQFYFHNDAKTAKTIRTKTKITPEQCMKLMNKMQEQSIEFQQTGGVHNTSLCKLDEIVVSRTDIGRHNALDKIYGYCLIHKIPLRDKVIAFSGRISSEVLLKTAKIGIGIILSKSAPTDLALNLADELGITAVGFIRGDKFNIYTHTDRVMLNK